RYQISLLSHEFFHDIEGKHSLFSDDHLMPIVGNNVPFESPPWDTTSSDPDLMKAYALLLGGDTGEQMGGQYHFMSASERAMVSLAVADQYPNQPSLLWINCPDLTDGATYNVKSLYSSGLNNCYKISFGMSDNLVHELYISNLQ